MWRPGVEISPLCSYSGENLEAICRGRTFHAPCEISFQSKLFSCGVDFVCGVGYIFELKLGMDESHPSRSLVGGKVLLFHGFKRFWNNVEHDGGLVQLQAIYIYRPVSLLFYIQIIVPHLIVFASMATSNPLSRFFG